MMKATKKQIKARARNWNKRMLSGAAYSLKSIVNIQYVNIGLTKYEQAKIRDISNQIFSLLKNWKKSI